MPDLSSEDIEIIKEFLVESRENLVRVDQELIVLEKNPHDKNLLASIFRTMHTLKGTAGFLAFSFLEHLAHQAESLLSQLRDGKLEVNAAIISVILESADAIREILNSIEASGKDEGTEISSLLERLKSATNGALTATGLPVSKASEALPPAPEPARQPVAIPVQPKPVQRESSELPRPEEAQRGPAAEGNIRVGVGLLDKLMDLVGELVLARNQILQFNAERDDSALNATSQRLNLITSELQEGVMKTRMQPIGVVWNTLPRMVRDMSVALDKQIELKLEGAETELDRTIIEAIKDPLVHLVRNACDHGIETPELRKSLGKTAHGNLILRAYHEGGQVNIELGDDGGGIDVARVRDKAIQSGILRPEQAEKLTEREIVNLIFQPGFSTAKEITNISGRGVGMDVVRSHIERIGGVIDVASISGRGTTIKIRIPLTLAIIPGLVITSGGERFVIPQASLLELIGLDGEESGRHIEFVHGTPVYRRRGKLLPVDYLNRILGLTSTKNDCAQNMVVLQVEDRQFGLVVDAIQDTQEIVVKALGKQLKGLALYAGATIMGDGKVALILDVPGLGHRSGVFVRASEGRQAAEQTGSSVNAESRNSLLLFQSGSFKRLAVPLESVARLEEISRSSVEHAAGGPVVQYRGRILPLVFLRQLLSGGNAESIGENGMLQVVVFQQEDRMVGMVVDRIIDVAEETVTGRQKSARRGILSSAIVGDRVTDFLDVETVFADADERTGYDSALEPENSFEMVEA